MLSRQERTAWMLVAVLLLAALAAAGWTAERWTPHAKPWARSTWLKITRPPPLEPDQARSASKGSATAAGSQETAPLATPRKCVQAGRTIYTDQACPAGSTEQWLEPAAIALPQ